MKKLLVFLWIAFSGFYLARYVEIDFLNGLFAQEKSGNAEEAYGQTETNIKTDLDELKYDFTEKEIDALVEQHDIHVETLDTRYEIKSQIEVIEGDIEIMKSRVFLMKKLYEKLNKKFLTKVETNKDSLDYIVGTYEKMKPVESGTLILKHKIPIVLKIVDGVKPAIAAKMFTEMLKVDTVKVTSIVERYTGFNSQYTKELMKKDIDMKEFDSIDDGKQQEKQGDENNLIKS